jgi:hypothetical protein
VAVPRLYCKAQATDRSFREAFGYHASASIPSQDFVMMKTKILGFAAVLAGFLATGTMAVAQTARCSVSQGTRYHAVPNGEVKGEIRRTRQVHMRLTVKEGREDWLFIESQPRADDMGWIRKLDARC